MDPLCRRICNAPLIVFNIIFLWGLFFSFLLFCLLAELIPFLSQHVGQVASNRLTNTDHRQAGGKSLPTPSAPLSLKQHFTNAEFELITWRSAGRSSKSLLGQRLRTVLRSFLRTVDLSDWSENMFFFFKSESCLATRLEIGTWYTSYKLTKCFDFLSFFILLQTLITRSGATFHFFPSIWCPCAQWQDGSTELKTTHHA